MENYAIIKDENHQLAIVPTLQPNYLSVDDKNSDKQKSLFEIRTILESTVFTHVSALHNVLSSTSNDVFLKNTCSHSSYFYFFG